MVVLFDTISVPPLLEAVVVAPILLCWCLFCVEICVHGVHGFLDVWVLVRLCECKGRLTSQPCCGVAPESWRVGLWRLDT